MNEISKSWGIWIVRGIASLVFGALTLAMPAASLAALVLVYGAYAFVDGAVMLGLAFRAKPGRGMAVLRGLLGIAAGVITFAAPGLTAVSLYVLIGAWALTTGVMELVLAVALRRDVPHLGGLVLIALLSIAAGIVMFALPLVGITTLIGVIAAYAFVNGIALVTFGMRIHRMLPTQLTHAAA